MIASTAAYDAGKLFTGSKVVRSVFLDRQALDLLSTLVPDTYLDLVDVVVGIYCFDRVVRRADARWTRALNLTIHQRDTQRLMRSLSSLRSLLAEATGDAWSLSAAASVEPSAAPRPALFKLRPLDGFTFALFSGGLDSLAGAIRFLESDRTARLALFSVATGTRTTRIQRQLAVALQRRYGKRVEHVQLRLLLHPANKYDKDSQRSRALVHATLGLSASVLSGSHELLVFENGVGAFNLPFNFAAGLADHSCAVRPGFLPRIEGFVGDFLGGSYQIRNESLLLTKSQLVRAIADAGHKDLVQYTVSCDSFPLRQAGPPQCGHCTSCILRRQALHAADMTSLDPGQLYAFDITRHDCDELAVMHGQSGKIASLLRQSEPYRGLVTEYPELGTLPVGVRSKAICDLYATYCKEWESLTWPSLAASAA